MAASTEQSFLTGWRKWPVNARVALHVAGRFAGAMLRGEMSPLTYPRFLLRAYRFLRAVRHNKIVKRGGLYKLQLYVPAYPTRAFFHLLGKLYRREPGPASVVLSMTRACRYRCPHCYQQRDRGADLALDELVAAVKEMQDLGVSFFDIEGGEPLLRFERLLALLQALDDRAEIWINTTGDGLQEEQVAQLRRAGLSGVMVSLHAPAAAAHDAFTGVPGSFDSAIRALRLFGRHGVWTAVNCCPMGELITAGGLERIFDLARDLECAFVQVIHGKAAGGWLGQENPADSGAAPIAALQRLHLAYNNSPAFGNHPCIAAQVFDERADLFGCTAGGVERFYVGADGEVQPCEFLGISFGNLREEDFGTIFARMREHFRVPGTDWLCCTQAAAIDAVVRERGLGRTPIPWSITREFIDSWERGPATRLYKQLGIYR